MDASRVSVGVTLVLVTVVSPGSVCFRRETSLSRVAPALFESSQSVALAFSRVSGFRSLPQANG